MTYRPPRIYERGVGPVTVRAKANLKNASRPILLFYFDRYSGDSTYPEKPPDYGTGDLTIHLGWGDDRSDDVASLDLTLRLGPERADRLMAFLLRHPRLADRNGCWR